MFKLSTAYCMSFVWTDSHGLYGLTMIPNLEVGTIVGDYAECACLIRMELYTSLRRCASQMRFTNHDFDNYYQQSRSSSTSLSDASHSD